MPKIVAMAVVCYDASSIMCEIYRSEDSRNKGQTDERFYKLTKGIKGYI